MHNRDARKLGESQRRLDVLSAWREAPSLFSGAERVAQVLMAVVAINSWNRIAVSTHQDLPPEQ